jgi:CPA1 family monovalent cation:H+ antiporter
LSISQAIAALLTLAALASYTNHRFLRLPATIGMMAIALAASFVLLLVAEHTALDVESTLGEIRRIDFRAVVLDGMLPYLLFAGALHVDLRRMKDHRLAVALLATLGVAVSTLVAGALLWAAASAMSIPLTFAQGLLFGALIAPTDPIAVLGILRSAKAPAAIEALMAGESLFNDGVGVVLFLALFGVVIEGGSASAGSIGLDLLREAGGGIAFGVAAGWLGCWLLKAVDDYPVEIFLTLALAGASYAGANALHLSGPLTAVAAGMMIASTGREHGMSDRTQEHLDVFWEVVDEMLNAVLFVLVGMEMVVVARDAPLLVLGAAAIVAVLAARWLSVAGVLVAMGGLQRFPRGTLTILTWGGLRGAISIALALSLPWGPLRETLLTATYVVVAFSVLVQGLTLARVTRSSA